MSEVTRILSAIKQGDPRAAEQILPLVYDELRKLAAQKMAREKPGHTLSATSLVHEAYVRLVDAKSLQNWDSRGHFFAAAAEAMRRILVENARRKRTLKRAGEQERRELEEGLLAFNRPPEEMLALDEAFERLNAEDSLAAKIAKLRVFAGLTLDEISDSLKLPRTTVYRRWIYGRAWLRNELRGEAPDQQSPRP